MPTGYPKKYHPEMYEEVQQKISTDNADFKYALGYVTMLIKRHQGGKAEKAQLLAFMREFVDIWSSHD